MVGSKYGLNENTHHGFRGQFLTNIGVFLSALGYGISFPLLSISLESMGASGQEIGMNAALPALGWLLGSYFLPILLSRFGLKQVLISCLLVSSISILVFFPMQNLLAWMLLRFLFGGSIGLFYRAVEFLINATSKDSVRGKNIGVYSVFFILGIAIGSSVQPFLGMASFFPFTVVSVLLVLTILIFASQSIDQRADTRFSRVSLNITIISAIPIALMAVFAYGFFEDIPAYLLAVYALRNNLSESVAAFTLTAAASGTLIFAVPIGYISDRMNRNYLIVICAVLVSVISAIIPQTLSAPTLFLILIAIWSGFAGSIYNVALSIIGDRFSGAELPIANASFGIIYATGSLIGPLANGYAIDQFNSQGLMVSAGMTFAIFVFFAVGIILKDQKYAC